jgi:hypothetical protein
MLAVAPPRKIVAKRGSEVEARIQVSLLPGYHCNSNTPSEDYLIPLRLAWTPGALEPAGIVYPKPQMEKYEFSPKPVSVFSGKFEIVSKFKAVASAPPGPGMLAGRLRYQACNDKACFPPRTVEVKLPYSLE